MSIRSVLFCLPAKSLVCFRKKVVFMPMVRVTCDLCGKDFQKLQIEIHKHNFCCREHFYQWNSKRVSKYNRTENPMNRPGGVLESRLKRSQEMRDSGEGKTYRKSLGRHEHRVVAEQKLGRPLRKGEIVHHSDGDYRNNDPDNLMVLPSQSDHCKIHGFGKKKKEGDAHDSNQ